MREFPPTKASAMRLREPIPMLLSVAGSMSIVAAQNATVRDGYAAPTYVAPYADNTPTIDGVVGDDEWQGAVSLNALQTTRRAISPRQTQFWLAWDEQFLYVAARPS